MPQTIKENCQIVDSCKKTSGTASYPKTDLIKLIKINGKNPNGKVDKNSGEISKKEQAIIIFLFIFSLYVQIVGLNAKSVN